MTLATAPFEDQIRAARVQRALVTLNELVASLELRAIGPVAIEEIVKEILRDLRAARHA